MFVMGIQTLDIAVLALATAIFVVLHRRSSQRQHPPGPPGLPFIGNVFDVPKRHAWLTYWKWSRVYGSDIIYINLLGTNVFILNSARAAQDLLEKRSNIYSDRQVTVMIHELTGWGRNIAFMEYGDLWRTHRRAFHRHFHERAAKKFHQQTTRSVHGFLSLLLDDPDGLFKHIRLSAGALLLDVAYGLEIQSQDDPYVEAAEKAVDALNQMGNTGTYLVDVIPILKYLPSWLPGAGFKRLAIEWEKAVSNTYNLPWNDVKRAMSEGETNVSIASTMLADIDGQEDQAQYEYIAQNVVGVSFAAGEDTSTATISSFFLAMLCHPDIQVAAQKELDGICGSGRLPQFEDQDKLPLIMAIMLETMRWRPALPLAFAHKSTTDDEYRGFYIPARSIVIGNTWSVLHDEEIYPDPETFNPYRFLTPEGKLRTDVPSPEANFGYGRRLCPGRHFALQSIWLTIASALATFDIQKPVDAHGNVIEPSGEYSPGVVSYPLPFKATIRPRSTAADLIRHLGPEGTSTTPL